jgi:hypothetical protein
MVEQIIYKGKKGLFLSRDEFEEYVEIINQSKTNYGIISEKFLKLASNRFSLTNKIEELRNIIKESINKKDGSEPSYRFILETLTTILNESKNNKLEESLKE